MAKTELLQIRLAEDVKEHLRELAAAENRTMGNYIENLIKREIERKSGAAE